MTTVEDKVTPTVIASYNKYMGGVHKSDQYCAYYPVGHQNKKWWRYIFHSLVNLCIVQAYLTWEVSTHAPVNKTYDHLMFHADIAEQLRAGFTSRKRKAGHSKAVPDAPIALASIDHHKLEKIKGRHMVCRQCIKDGRRTAKGRGVETSYMCSFCQVPLCFHRNDCFRDYHGQNVPQH
ncbi:uncharacterized protein LOC143290159 [Babylonia areolata]|uniref:uncharacterized protein LOC143290159 n=1 Tax=Babylonia areolata TaxID=304850 RepID=UPI003FD4B991